MLKPVWLICLSLMTLPCAVAQTVADAKEPLEIRWLGSSFLDIPFRR